MKAGYSLRASALLNAFWVPLAFQEAALLAIAVPARLLDLAPKSYTSALATVASLSAVVSMIAPPIAGAISDQLRRKHGGMRKTIIVSGAVIDIVFLLLAMSAKTTLQFGAFFVLSILGAMAATAAYQALLPDLVPRQAWGEVSGIRGAATLVGTVIGLAVAATVNPNSTLLATACFVVIGTASVYAIRANPVVGAQEEEHARVRDWHDFIIAFISRLFIGFGLSLLMTFALYFFHDVLRVANPQAGTGLVAGASLIGAIISTIVFGKLSDRFGRKRIVAFCGIPMALAACGFALVPNMHAIYAFALLFGLGYGGVFSSAWALAIDSIPQLRDVARDLGIWGLASNIPGIIAPIVGGWILARFGTTTFAYQLLFFGSGLSFAAGSVVVLGIRGPRTSISIPQPMRSEEKNREQQRPA
ncbi:MAG: MFS transporter [Vulcanimicrobiaceae bacterium]